MRIHGFLVFCLFFVFACKANHTSISLSSSPDEDLTKYMYKPKVQETNTATQVKEPLAQIKFEKEINANLKLTLDSMALANKRYQSAPGYRIMVYSGGSSEESSKAKKHVYDWSIEYEVYAQYKQPAFRVKVGNFPDRIKAFEVLSDLIKIFPNAVIIPDQIEIK
jgi:hypothetical protein